MYEELKNCAIEAALEAGEILKNGFGTSFQIRSKEGRNNLVTEYDIKSEKLIIDKIRKEFPRHSFLAEESGITGAPSENEVRWIIDPLDGTVNFAHSIPIFSVSIAAEIQGEIVAGVIYHPVLDELYVASKDTGAYMNGNKISVSDNADLKTSILVTGFPYDIEKNPYNSINIFAKVVEQGIPIRRLGSAALDMAYVASGKFDGFWENDLKPWDVGAGIILVREAGGIVTNYSNDDYKIGFSNILATNGLIHKQATDLINENRYYVINEI